jgi:hypothetical protein
MPLAFDSISHGPIAFGFFNIDSDMLLLDRYFFFATDFCRRIIEMAHHKGPLPYQTSWDVYAIPDPADIGDLMGAIHGVRHTGFIGEVYLKFPFPERPEDFKQKPEGWQTQAELLGIINKFAHPITVPVAVDAHTAHLSIGPYQFTRTVFHELIRYVWQGGYPRWKDDIRPDYVLAMNEAIHLSGCEIMQGLKLSV